MGAMATALSGHERGCMRKPTHHAHAKPWACHPDADIRKAIKAPVAVRTIAHMEENSPEWLPKITRKRGKKTERVF